jgi:hypothetical protein
VNIGANTYAVIESKSWDINISGPDANKELYVSFEIDLNIGELTLDPSKIYGSISLDRFDDKHIFEYDASNRIIFAKLIATNDSGPFLFSTTRYKYDALGQMISREVKSQGQVLDDSTFIYEQGNPVLEYDDVGRLERASLYAQNLDLLLATDDLDFDGTSQTAETVWVLSDYQGTVTGLYVSADRYKRVSYDDYGRPHNTTSSILDETHLNETHLYHIVRFGYLGMYYDIDTYLYSDGTRPYDSTSGRYLTASGLGSGVNYVYSFANNTPVDRTTAAVSFGRNSSIPSYWSGFDIGTYAAQNAQGIRDAGDYLASSYRRTFNRIADNGGGFFFAFHAEIGAKQINFGASILSIFADPNGFLDGIYERGAEYYRAGGGGINGSFLAFRGTLGLTGIEEAISGVDILTGEALNGDERFDRGMFGVSAALTLAGSPGLFASGRSLLAQAGKIGPKINLVPPSLSTNFSKLSNRVAQTVGKWQNGPSSGRYLDPKSVSDFTLAERLDLQTKYQSLINVLQRGVDVPMPRGAVSWKMMGEITVATGKEVGLIRVGKVRVLRMGTYDGIDLSDATRVIAHTHPSGNLRFSGVLGGADGDIPMFRLYQPKQHSSGLVAPDGTFKRLPIPRDKS